MRARKRFGQHFLEPAWVRKVVTRIAPAPGDLLLEIGPGRGALTRELVAGGAGVVAVEVDRDLAAALAADLGPRARIVTGDVLRVDLARIVRELAGSAPPGRRVRVVGNLPYNVTSPIVIRLLEVARETGQVADAVLMVQHEVAERLAAGPGGGDYGPLAVAVQLWADVERLLTLPPGAFRPPPRVVSALVRLVFRPPRVEVADAPLFGALVRAVFSQRRKTLANALRPFAARRGVSAERVLGAAGIDGRRRPQTLDLAELAALARAVATSPTHAVL